MNLSVSGNHPIIYSYILVRKSDWFSELLSELGDMIIDMQVVIS